MRFTNPGRALIHRVCGILICLLSAANASAGVTILGIDEQEKANKKAHHTDKFADDFVLRRGDPFEVIVKLSKDYNGVCHEIYFKAVHSFGGGSTEIPIPASNDAIPAGQWGAQRLAIAVNGDKSRSVKIKISVPADAGVGAYTFTALVRKTTNLNPDSTKAFSSPVTIIFNPWHMDDSVYLATAAHRDEYVLSEKGRVWLEGATDPVVDFPWDYDQFDKITLKVTLALLNGLNATDRANPVVVARRLTKMVNSNDADNGVLEGNWSDDYTGGKSPLEWTRSGEIIKAYDAAGNMPVKFGQCWVFGGVLNSCLRCIGIPARPLTNFVSLHDKDNPPNKAWDRYWKKNVNAVTGKISWRRQKGNGTEKRERDSRWNYHVWCDAWMRRPDRANPHHDFGWQALDATPQEPSDGVKQMGPAPHSAIMANAGGNYDVAFVVAEVDGDVKDWRYTVRNADGTYDDLLHATDTTTIGTQVLTKAVGTNGVSNIVGEYKADARGAPPSGGELLPVSGVWVALDAPATLNLGDDLICSIRLDNLSAEEHEVSALATAHVLSYNGDLINSNALAEITEDRIIMPGGTETISVQVPESLYTLYTGVTRTFEFSVGLQVQGTEEVYLDVRQSVFLNRPLSMSVNALEPVPVGAAVDVLAEFANPFGQDLTDTVFLFIAPEAFEVVGESTEFLGTVPAGEIASAARTLIAHAPGQHLVAVKLSADQLNGVADYAYITVFSDCNDNGVDDAEDIGSVSLDCNTNGIPDECEADCDLNGTPDDCDLALNPAADCNANRIPDACDIAAGTSLDADASGIPDECELPDEDCNANGTPDPEEVACELSADCQSNGIPDECDIAGTVAHNCCEAHGGLGCTDASIEACVCATDPFCCEVFWDSICAGEVVSLGCGSCMPGSSDCNLNATPDECELAGGDCQPNSVPDDCDIIFGTSADANGNAIPDECEGVPAAIAIGAVSRRVNPRPSLPNGACDTNLLPPRRSEPHQGGVQEVRISFDIAPGTPSGSGITLHQATCVGGGLFGPYTGGAMVTGSVSGNTLVLNFTPSLENARTYRLTLGPEVTSIPGQVVFVRGLAGDANSDGFVNATDRSLVVGAWTGSGFTCTTDVNNDGFTNAVDRSLVVGAWTGGPSMNCAP